MAVNKVIDRNNNILIDLTDDTVTPNKVVEGEVFHDRAGNIRVGTLKSVNDVSNVSLYRFVDYDGTLVQAYTDAEIDALNALPTLPDRDDENLKFQGWNWTLDELKNIDRTRGDMRPIIGPHYITKDGKTYLKIDVLKPGDYGLTFARGYAGKYDDNSRTLTIDWGDGTVETKSVSRRSGNATQYHSYSLGTYLITIETEDFENNDWIIRPASTSSSYFRTLEFKVGKIAGVFYSINNTQDFFDKVNVPVDLKVWAGGTSEPGTSLGFKEFTFPKGCLIANNQFGNGSSTPQCFSVRADALSFPAVITTENTYTGTSSFTIYLVSKFGVYLTADFEGLNSAAITVSTSGVSDIALSNPSGLYLSPYNEAGSGYYSVNDAPGVFNVRLTNSSGTRVTFRDSLGLTIDADSIKDFEFASGGSRYTIFKNDTEIVPPKITNSLSIGNSSYYGGGKAMVILNLTKSDFIKLTSNPSWLGSVHKVRVPADLLDTYKSASYWSNYAEHIIS